MEGEGESGRNGRRRICVEVNGKEKDRERGLEMEGSKRRGRKR